MRKNRSAIKMTVRLIGILLILSTCVFLGFRKTSPIMGRLSSLSYSLSIHAKPGERPRNVIMYLPFPLSGDELTPGLIEKMKHDIERFADLRGSHVEPVDTKYGRMLKVRMPVNAFRSYNADPGGFGMVDEFQYGRLFPIGKAYEDDQLRPVLPATLATEPISLDAKTKAIRKEVPIYVDYEGGSGFRLYIKYSAGYTDQYVPAMLGGHGRQWYIGKRLSPRAPDSLNIEVAEKDWVEITKKGWTRVPVWIVCDANDKTL